MNVDALNAKIQALTVNVTTLISEWSHSYFVLALALVFSSMILVGISPLRSTGETSSFEMFCIGIRKALFWSLWMLLGLFVLTGLFVFLALGDNDLGRAYHTSTLFFWGLLQEQWLTPVLMIVGAFMLRVSWFRWGAPLFSALFHRFRRLQKTNTPSDIRDEVNTYQQKDFDPSQYYTDTGIFIGLDDKDQPDYIPLSTWREVSMQLIGPSRYGKGVLLGCVMDQIINNGDGLVYIDPKADAWAPRVMYQAAKRQGRAFYYLALHDEGPGYWAPFEGGTRREAFSRLCAAFGLEYTKESGTDFYKSQETAALEGALKVTRSIAGLRTLLKDNDQTLRINAELTRWSEFQTFCPPKGKASFSIEKAIQENAVVYLQGGLDDTVVTTATKVFIAEYVQTARKLFHRQQRPAHLTMVVDEVSFLVSEILAKALATNLGFSVNFVLAYQSPGDLLNIDDKTSNPGYLAQSIMSNTQVKVNYGGTDKDSAELVSALSGTVTQTVLRSEKTDIEAVTGGETWEHGRSMMQQEAPLIHPNTMYALPPRVCAVFQPRRLAQIRYTSHVPVEAMSALEEFMQAHCKMIEPCDDVVHVLSERESRRPLNTIYPIKMNQHLKTLSLKHPKKGLSPGSWLTLVMRPIKTNPVGTRATSCLLRLKAAISKQTGVLTLKGL